MNLTNNTFLDWTIKDFIIYYFITKFTLRFGNLFHFKNFPIILTSGHLNQYLVRPISSYFCLSIENLRSGKIVITTFFFLILMIIFFIFPLENFGFAILLWTWGFTGSYLFINFTEIISFYFVKGFGLRELKSKTNDITRTFTFASFEQNKILSTIIFIFLPQALYSFLTYEILRGNLQYFFNYINYIILYTIIMIIINCIMWKQGLKKYEAFG
jgi:ABC-type uncharacterized transport system permease subunit